MAFYHQLRPVERRAPWLPLLVLSMVTAALCGVLPFSSDLPRELRAVLLVEVIMSAATVRKFLWGWWEASQPAEGEVR